MTHDIPPDTTAEATATATATATPPDETFRMPGVGPGMIQLTNPEVHNFKAFIIGNATKCDRVVEQNAAEGQTLVICGAGPSLRHHAAKWCAKGDQVWACNSALPYLVREGHKVTHGFTVDQTPHMCAEWHTTPDVEYLIASTVHPHLVALLAARGRSFTFFHNYVGIQERPVQWPDENGVLQGAEFEDWMYLTFYPPTIRAGSGLNAVTRAIDVAEFMGFRKIVVLGADCAIEVTRPMPRGVRAGSPEHVRWLKEATIMHADGSNAISSGATPMTMHGVIDGRHWETKPDMVITATWLVKMRRRMGNRLTLIGDTLPNALRNKSDEFLERMPALVTGDGTAVPVG